MSLCLSSALASAVLATNSFTLIWTHSIEKTQWEEDWRLVASQLWLTEARILSSGAGMETPPEATLINGVWHYHVKRQLEKLSLLQADGFTSYVLCANGVCHSMEYYLKASASGPIELKACPA